MAVLEAAELKAKAPMAAFVAELVAVTMVATVVVAVMAAKGVAAMADVMHAGMLCLSLNIATDDPSSR